MKEFFLIVFALITFAFCITKICEAIKYDKFLKNQSKDFDKLLTKIIEKAEVEVVKKDKNEEKKDVKKPAKRGRKKKESEEENA